MKVLPLEETAKTQWPPFLTFKTTSFPELRAEAAAEPPLTNPSNLRPNEAAAPHIKRLPEANPLLLFNQLLKEAGVIVCPLSWTPSAARMLVTEVIRQPDWQMVLEPVPRVVLPHLESHYL